MDLIMNLIQTHKRYVPRNNSVNIESLTHKSMKRIKRKKIFDSIYMRKPNFYYVPRNIFLVAILCWRLSIKVLILMPEFNFVWIMQFGINAWSSNRRSDSCIKYRTFLLSRCAYLDTQQSANDKYARFVKKASIQILTIANLQMTQICLSDNRHPFAYTQPAS